MGNSISMKGVPPTTAKFTQNPTTKVFTDDDREVQPGSGEAGMVAAGGMVPIGYFKDPEKSARTFRTIDGVRYSFPGDLAMVAEDGSLILLGRGSQVINSGGEKIFPEEVEEAVKRVPGVARLPRRGHRRREVRPGGHRRGVARRRRRRRRSHRHRRRQASARRLQGAEEGRLRQPCAPRSQRQGRLQGGPSSSPPAPWRPTELREA